MINQFKPNRMKKNNFKKTAMTFLMVIMALANAVPLMAQKKSDNVTVKVVAQKKAEVDDKEVIGVWVMEYMHYDGGKKEMLRQNYSSVKVYRANGEYACAEIVRLSNGSYRVLPHEYGTYTLKNGRYSEMGRPVVAADGFVFDDKTHFHGHYMNRVEGWVKSNLPDKLVDYIVAQCKAKQEGDPQDIQQMIHQHILNK